MSESIFLHQFTLNESQLLEYPKKFIELLSAPFIGREEEAKVITLALISKEHATLIGEPGTAKSALARRAAELLDAKFFMYLLTKYTEPTELFGALDINALKQGVYRRITKDRLPESEIAFLDEIFKANSAILNTLLSLLNERVIYDGYNTTQVPLRTLISASNEVPNEPELDALYDRLLLRHFVKSIDRGFIRELMKSGFEYEFSPRIETQKIMTINDLEVLYNLVRKVNLSPIEEKLVKIIVTLEDKGFHLSDRRKAKIMKMIGSHSILNGRLIAKDSDLLVLKYIIPNDQEEFNQVYAILIEELGTIEKYLRELEQIERNIASLSGVVDKESNITKLAEISQSLKPTRERILSIMREMDNNENMKWDAEKIKKKAETILNNIDEIAEKIGKKLGLI